MNDKYLHLIIPQVEEVLNRIGPGGNSRDYVYMSVNQTADQAPFQYRIKWYKYNKGIVAPAPNGVADNKYFIQVSMQKSYSAPSNILRRFFLGY